jgi:hypothetical protein
VYPSECDRPLVEISTNRNIIKLSAAIASAGVFGRIAARAIDAMLGEEANTVIGDKINRQMSRRGWSADDINQTIESPYTTRSATNRANGNQATAYYRRDGSYVVRDNKTGDVVQVSNRNDPTWVPDATINDPYRPQ